MTTENFTIKIVKNSFWSIFDVLLRQGLNFVITVVLARLLTPSDYGKIGILMIFITIINVIVDSGFASGIIRKIDRTDDDLYTAFIFNILIALLSYFIIFLAAPFIASFFEDLNLVLQLRVLGIVVIVNSLNVVQNAILIYKMQMKQVVKVGTISSILTGTVAILMAYNGFGVWSLISQQLAFSVFSTLLLFKTTKWKPRFVFSYNSFKYLWSYGSRLLAARLIGSFFGQLYFFIIGKSMGNHDLGLFSRSEQFAQQPKNILINIISKVLFPALSESQSDIKRIRKNYIQCAELLSFIIFPLMFSLALMADSIFHLLFGSKWDEAIPLFRILCIGYSVDVFSQLSSYLIQAMGRSDYGLKLELFKKPIFIIVLVVSIYYGLKGITIGASIYAIIATLINMSVVKILLHYSYWQQLKDITKYAIIAISTSLPTYFIISTLCKGNVFRFLVYGFFIIIFYYTVCRILNVKAIKIIMDIASKI